MTSWSGCSAAELFEVIEQDVVSHVTNISSPDTGFHVDAAYGGALAFSERHRERLAGIDRADSVTIDPHEWMFVPFACGALLVHDGADVLRDAFDITPEYLTERRGHGEDERFNYFRLGQLGTRRGSALTVWATLRAMGTDGYAAIELVTTLRQHAHLVSRRRGTSSPAGVRVWRTALPCRRVTTRPAQRRTAACWLADDVDAPLRTASSLVVQAPSATACKTLVSGMKSRAPRRRLR